MTHERFGFTEDAFETLVVLTGSGYAMYVVLAAAHYAVFFHWQRKRFLPDYLPDWRQNLAALRLSFLSICGASALTVPMHVLIAKGYGQVYWDVDDYGWGYLLLSLLAMLVVTETAVYWVHRALHLGPIYSRIHRYHHEFKRPTPWVGVAFHPIDAFVQALPHHLCAFFFPIHVGVYLGMVTAVTIWAIAIHDRVSFVSWKAINYTDHHTLHHWHADYNYGQYTTFWDRLCGSYLDPTTTRDQNWRPKTPRPPSTPWSVG